MLHLSSTTLDNCSLDGLAAGCVAIVLLAYIGITFITSGQRDLTMLAACLGAACIGFLWFNVSPRASSWATPARSG